MANSPTAKPTDTPWHAGTAPSVAPWRSPSASPWFGATREDEEKDGEKDGEKGDRRDGDQLIVDVDLVPTRPEQTDYAHDHGSKKDSKHQQRLEIDLSERTDMTAPVRAKGALEMSYELGVDEFRSAVTKTQTKTKKDKENRLRRGS